MRQKDELIESLKQKLKDEKNRLSQVQTLTSMDMDQLRMTSEDTEMRLKNEIIEQRKKTNLFEHERIGERMTADQLRRDKEMILDNEANVKAIMENFKEENSELAEVNYKLRLRVTEALQGKWDDPPTSPNKKIIEDFRGELSRLQHELRRKENMFLDKSSYFN